MQFRFAGLILLSSLLTLSAAAQDSPASPQESPGQGPGARSGQGRGRGWGMGLAGRGVLGTVSEVAADHYTIKTQMGETYTVHYSANTKVVQQPAQRSAPGAMRAQPQQIKSEDIRVGDAIMALGEIDPAGKSVGAMTVVKVDPEHAREMREMQANFGKTWLMGRVTAVNETKVTLQSPVDNAEHTFMADENTTFRRRREPVTLADIQPGTNIRVDGAVKEGVFVATGVNVMGPPVNGGPVPHEGPPPQ